MCEDGEQIDPIPMKPAMILTITLCVLPLCIADKKVKEKD